MSSVDLAQPSSSRTSAASLPTSGDALATVSTPMASGAVGDRKSMFSSAEHGGGGGDGGDGARGGTLTDLPPPEMSGELRAYRNMTRVQAYLSIVIAVATMVIEFAAAAILHSDFLFGAAVGSIFRGVASGLVLWRFFSPLDEAYSEAMRWKDRRAGTIIAIIFICYAVSLITQGIVHIVVRSTSDVDLSYATQLITLYFITCALYALLFGLKFHLAKLVQSGLVRRDAWTYLAGAVVSLFAGLKTIIYKASDGGGWWIDAVAVMAVGVCVAISGFRTLAKRRVWDKQFWSFQDDVVLR